VRRIYDELAEFVGIRRSTVENPGENRLLKRRYEDFIVEEITPEGDLISIEKPKVNCYHRGKGYTRAALIKAGRETHEAIRYIARRLRIREDHIGFAGTKDKRAITAQRISIKGIKPEEAIIEEERIKLLSPVECGAPIRLGELRGNRFTVTMRDGIRSDKAREEVLEKGFVNYYGFQRFGANRPVSHIVGRFLLLDEIDKAVDAYIAAESLGLLPEKLVKEPPEASIAREEYARGNLKAALESFPKSYIYERRLIACLLKGYPKAKCFVKAFPYRLRMMFVHAFQAYVRNVSLSRAIEREELPSRRPLPGFRTRIPYAKDLLKGISGSKRRRNRLPGGRRETIARVDGGEILERSSDSVKLRFSLRKGVYASVMLFEAFNARE